MKIISEKSLIIVIVFSVATLVLPVYAATADASVPVRMCYEEQQLEPYFMGAGPQPPSENPGIFIEILQMLDKQLQDVEFVFYRAPWKRCLNAIREGSTDVIIASYSKDREELGIYPKTNENIDESLSISTAQYCLFTLRNSALDWNGSEFSIVPDKPFAVPQGYSIIDLLAKHDMPMVLTNSSVGSMELLAKGRAEAAVTFCEAGAHFLLKNAQGNTGIIARSPALNQREAYLVFSRHFWSRYASSVEQIWRIAATLRDREFPGLLEKYEALQSEGGLLQ